MHKRGRLSLYPILLIYGGKDLIFPMENARRFASTLRSNSVPIDLKIIPDVPNDMEPDRNLIFRCIGEYCLKYLTGTNSWRRYHSIAEWRAEAPPFWLFCLPAAAWAAGCFAWLRCRKPVPREKLKLKPNEIILRCVAVILATWALSDIALHLVPPHFAVTKKIFGITRKYLVPPKERADFEYLGAQPIWKGVKLQTLMTHVELANYNRELINWRLDETNYQNYVLSPVITGKPDEQFNWRRPLWEEFYPRVRHESSPTDAAAIIVSHLRGRVTIANVSSLPHKVPEIWLRQITDKRGFEIIYVAALRSVGVPARLDQNGRAEFFNGFQWHLAPRPIVESFCDN